MTQDFFYTKNDQSKLIQNIVFEFVDDNLESVIERKIKEDKLIPQIQVKVIFRQPLEIYVSVAQWTQKYSY